MKLPPLILGQVKETMLIDRIPASVQSTGTQIDLHKGRKSISCQVFDSAVAELIVACVLPQLLSCSVSKSCHFPSDMKSRPGSPMMLKPYQPKPTQDYGADVIRIWFGVESADSEVSQPQAA